VRGPTLGKPPMMPMRSPTGSCANAAEAGVASIAVVIIATSMVRTRLDERDIGPPGGREAMGILRPVISLTLSVSPACPHRAAEVSMRWSKA
jgi:hypothetical protein